MVIWGKGKGGGGVCERIPMMFKGLILGFVIRSSLVWCDCVFLGVYVFVCGRGIKVGSVTKHSPKLL